jgi:hypothetical protein
MIMATLDIAAHHSTGSEPPAADEQGPNGGDAR